jgi:hypothetical protein
VTGWQMTFEISAWRRSAASVSNYDNANKTRLF